MRKYWSVVLSVAVVVLALTSSARSFAEPAPQVIMFYMVGSDLESDGGIASRDMAEIAQAAQDDAVRVLVYAGGASKWHSAVPEGKDAIFQLAQGQWTLIQAMSQRNMGDSGTLSGFLRFGVQRYPGSSCGLVLWDHGSGPMMGYGEDENHGRDRLTLPEIREALTDSPFSEANKLEWVGFDACLMGSIETAHILAPFARYMIASQEAEPNDGWNYAFLKDVKSGVSGSEVGRLACDAYLSGNLEKYNEYPDYAPPVTMSCLDLGRVPNVEQDLNALANRMGGDLTLDTYARVARRRVSLAGFGRFTTGSEYDLVDLGALATAMLADFPEEAAELAGSLNALVLHNASNVDGAGGVSIYYPFYNKPYYTRSWRREYIDLGFASGYTDFLQQYARIWLGDQIGDGAREDLNSGFFLDGECGVKLTPEQVATYAQASYYLLQHDEGEKYQIISGSNDVQLTPDGLLTADFDGKALFCVDAVTGEVSTGLINSEQENEDGRFATYTVWALFEAFPTGEISSYETKLVDFQLKVDNRTGRTEIQGIIPRVEDQGLGTGKRQLRQSDADNIVFLNGNYYKTYDDDGHLLPPNEWKFADTAGLYFFSKEAPGGEKVRFQWMDIDKSNRDLYIMLVLRDIQGNRRAFEPVPIQILPLGSPKITPRPFPLT